MIAINFRQLPCRSPFRVFSTSQSFRYKHGVEFEPAGLFVFLPLSLCSSRFGRPLDHRLSLPSLAHRNYPHSLASHTLRTLQQVIIPHKHKPESPCTL